MTETQPLPTPKLVYVKIKQICIPKSTQNERYRLFEQVMPNGDGVFSNLIRMPNGHYGTSTVLAFKYDELQKTTITFVVTQLFIQGELEIMRLVLPLSWFPVNYVVQYGYPFITRTPEKGTPFGFIDVHLSENGTAPFAAMPSRLLVQPNWGIPQALIPKMPVNVVNPYPGQFHPPVPATAMPAGVAVAQHPPSAQRPANQERHSEADSSMDYEDGELPLQDLDMPDPQSIPTSGSQTEYSQTHQNPAQPQ